MVENQRIFVVWMLTRLYVNTPVLRVPVKDLASARAVIKGLIAYEQIMPSWGVMPPEPIEGGLEFEKLEGDKWVPFRGWLLVKDGRFDIGADVVSGLFELGYNPLDLQ